MFVLGLWELTSYYAVAKLRQYIYIVFFFLNIYISIQFMIKMAVAF